MTRLTGLLALLLIALVPSLALAQTAAPPDLPTVLVSRQAATALGLAVGSVVQLAPPDGSRARDFRVAGIYEPTPDPARLGNAIHAVRLHLPDLLTLTAETDAPKGAESVDAINIRLTPGSDATAFARDVNARLPGVVARPTSDAGAAAGPFRVLQRFHLAIAVVTIVASTVFLVALTVMLVDERRETVGVLRLIGLPASRVLVQVLLEGVLVAGAGSAFGLVLALASESAINHFFQWRYDTALLFVQVTPSVALTCVLIAIPLGVSATVVASWLLLRRKRAASGAAMKALRFAWRSLVRQPARATLGVLGVAAVGALLFDMLMLSDGLIVSMRDLLDRTGFDIRISTSGDLQRGQRLPNAAAALRSIGSLPSVGTALAIRFVEAEADRPDAPAASDATSVVNGDTSGSTQPGAVAIALQGVMGATRPWTVLQGRDPRGPSEVVVSQALAAALRTAPGEEIALRPHCLSGQEVPPPTRLQVTGVAEFPFELVGEGTAGGAMAVLDAACGGSRDEADIILARATGEPDVTAAAIRAAEPRLTVATNEQVLGRLQRNGFTYFRQISTVLTTVTLGFALLLITVLLTVSVNQRLGEIAALRALGFSRGRVVADVLCESLLIVGMGGLLSLPLGAMLAQGLDAILKTMPGIPAAMYFFVFEPATLGLHATLLGLTAVVAALYPIQVVARLPIAATLRNEVLS